jgi:hypothetical protein
VTTPHPVEVRSYFDPELRLSIELPADWDIGSTDEFPLVVLAPLERGFRANAGFSDRALDPPTKEGFIAAIEQLKSEQADDFERYEVVGERRSVQDGCPAYMVRCRWDLEQGPTRVVQIAALYAVGSVRLVEVHCTALAELESVYLPMFQRLLDSLRFIPATD